MRMRVKWYKLNINVDSEGCHHLKEIPHIKGRYCKRNEVESILERINEQISDSGDELNHLINDIIEIKAHCEQLDTETGKKIDTVIGKLGELKRRTKKCKRPVRLEQEVE